MARNRTKLTMDMDALFPGDALDVCGNAVVIRPLNLLQLALITKQLKSFSKVLVEDGVTFQNYKEPTSILKIATVLVDQFPELLAECSGIEVESLQELTLDIIVEIIDKIITVNMSARESLEKNFKSLVTKIQTAQAKS